ncbi:dCTP deaminase [Patescibacteria group bacterium]
MLWYSKNMVLSDADIRKKIESNQIEIVPIPDLSSQLGSCSIDLRLGKKFRIFNYSRVPFIDPNNSKNNKSMMTEIEVKNGEPFILQPSDFVLATTMESFRLPTDLLARLEGRSSLGRLGIVVHSTASVFDPGWDGVAVLELGNLGRMPVALYPGMRICALTFEELSSPAQTPYGKKKSAKYIGQNSPIASRIDMEQD